MPLPFPSKAPAQYTTSKQMIAGSDFNNLAAQLNSAEDGITATAAGSQATSYQLKAAVNNVTVVASANDGVRLPKGFVGLTVWVRNADAADSLRVFPYPATAQAASDTINGGANADIAGGANNVTIFRVISVSATGAANWITK